MIHWKYGVVGGLVIMTVGLGLNEALNDIGYPPGHEALRAGDLACAQHNGVKQLRYAPEGKYRVLCKDGTYIQGPTRSWPQGHTNWRITQWTP